MNPAAARQALDADPEDEPDVQRIEGPTAREKILATFAAKLALAGGFVLLELHDQTFVVQRWNLHRHLPDLAAVAAFCRQVGAL